MAGTVAASNNWEDACLPILGVTSKSCQELFAFWHSSLDGLNYPQSHRHVVHLAEEDPPPGHCTASWVASASCGSGQRWLQEVVNYIASHQGQRVICAGPGVQFLPSFVEAQQRWLRQMDEACLDLLFAAELRGPLRELRPGEVSTSFFIVDCSSRSLALWQKALDRQASEPAMVGFLPRGGQAHLNGLLTFRAGHGTQDGDCGVRWDLVANEDVLWTDTVPEHNANAAPLHIASGATQVAQLGHVFDKVFCATSTQQSYKASIDAAAAKAEDYLLAEVDQITSEISRLRQELSSAPCHELERHRASLELAAAELVDEVERLIGDFAPAHQAITPSLEVFESVD